MAREARAAGGQDLVLERVALGRLVYLTGGAVMGGEREAAGRGGMHTSGRGVFKAR